MSKLNKWIIGFFTFFPILAIIPFFYSMFGFIMKMENIENSGVEPGVSDVFGSMSGFFIWIFLMVIVSTATFIYYLIHAIRNKAIEDNERIIWILVFLFASGIGQIVYFFMRIVPLPEPTS